MESNFIRRLLPAGAFDQFDHPIHERLARIGRHLNNDSIGKNRGAAGDGRAIAPGFLRMTGADSPVMADSLMVVAAPSMISPSAVNQVVGFANEQVAAAGSRPGDDLFGLGR